MIAKAAEQKIKRFVGWSWFAFCFGAFAMLGTQAATTCPAGYSNTCFISCVCLPSSGPAAKTGARPVQDGLTEKAGNALAAWLQTSRNTFLKGSAPITANMKQMLAPYVSPDILARARYRIGDAGTFNAAGLSHPYGQNSDTRAVTLVDVIVFHDLQAASQPDLWIHELYHVKQFHDAGVRNFALRYARDYHAIEDPAYVMQNQFIVRYNETQVVGSPPVPLVAQNICVAKYQPPVTLQCRLAGQQPAGTPCSCQTPSGALRGVSQ